MFNKRKKIIVSNLLALILLICLAILNSYNNHYLSQEIIFKIIGFICALQFLGSLFLSLYYFLKKENDKYLGFTFLIWLGINLLFIFLFIVFVFAMSAAPSGAITG